MKTLYVIVVLLLLSFLYLLYDSNVNFKKTINSQAELLDRTRENFLLHILNRGLYQISDQIEVHDIDLNTISSNYIVENRQKLAFRMTDQACGKCITEIINLINSLPSSKQNDIVFLVSSKNPKFLFGLKEKLSKSILLYRIDYSVLENPFETTDTPYFFVLTPELKMSSFHIPDSSNLRITKEYIERVENMIIQKL